MIEKVPDIIEGTAMLIGFFSVIAVFTPTPVDNAVLGVLKKILDFAAMNWGHAANAEKARKYDAEKEEK